MNPVLERRRLRRAAAFAASVAIGCLAAGASAHDARVLLHKHSCYLCHADREAKTGPAFADIAAHYGKSPQAVAKVVALIRQGAFRGGPWHMPPHPEVSTAEARSMARYILSARYERPLVLFDGALQSDAANRVR